MQLAHALIAPNTTAATASNAGLHSETCATADADATAAAAAAD